MNSSLDACDGLIAFRRGQFIVSSEEFTVARVLRAMASIGGCPKRDHAAETVASLEADELSAVLAFAHAISLWRIEHRSELEEFRSCGSGSIFVSHPQVVVDAASSRPKLRGEGFLLHELVALLATGKSVPLIAEILNARASVLAAGIAYLAHVTDLSAASYRTRRLTTEDCTRVCPKHWTRRA